MDGGAGSVSYEESKQRIQSQDPKVRAGIAQREDAKPEVLYYLAEDPSAEVRAEVAANIATPYQADVILASDRDVAVRHKLASKVSRILPDLGPDDQKRAEAYVEQVLETLARDEAVRVRQVLAETIKDLTGIPAAVVRRLARDAEVVVAAPVLEFSPLLSEHDLIEIIEGGCASGQLQAISRRRRLAAPAADAIVAVDDEPAITALLSNESALIREETLDRLVGRAQKFAAWHEPLVGRPKLSMNAVRKLAGFVADRLLEQLESRKDLDTKTAKTLAKEVKKRLRQQEKEQKKKAKSKDKPAPDRVRELEEKGELTEEIIVQNLSSDRAFVKEALAVRANLNVTTVGKVLDAKSAKGVMALTWKAGLSPEFALQLQSRMGGIAPRDLLRPRSGQFPLSEDEMNWQLELFESMAG